MARKQEKTPEPVEEMDILPDEEALEAVAEETEVTSAADDAPAFEAETAAEENGAVEGNGQAAGGKVRKYRPTEDYNEGDRIYHPIWNVEGVVTYRDPREQIFRTMLGRAEERGRCRMIRVQFEKDVPASGGARREVMLIADWHGHGFDVGPQPVKALPETESLLEGRETAREERPAARKPALPEIPDIEDEAEEDVEEDAPVEEEREAEEI